MPDAAFPSETGLHLLAPGRRAHARIEPADELPLCEGLRVFKFGGSSLATPDRIRDVARIVLDRIDGMPAVVVVSAFQGVTDRLLACAELAARADPACERAYGRVAARHRFAVDSLLAGVHAHAARARVDELLGELRAALDDIRVRGRRPPALDSIASFGERLSARIVASYLNQFANAEFVDARRFVTTDDDFTRAGVLLPETECRTRQYFESFWRQSRSRLPIVTGFIGRTRDGRTTTIGRNGSDYTAAIIGGALGASSIEIWTDVDGVLSADPRTVPSAFALSRLTYDEAAAMAHLGAKVLHADTIGPAVARSIPIIIKNSFKPDAQGTRISRKAAACDRPARSLASVDDVTLLTLRVRAPDVVRGAAGRVFGALASARVNVMLSTQASPDATISLVVKNADAAAAAQTIRREFHAELQRRAAVLRLKRGQAIIALVGAAKRGTAAAQALFAALERHDIAVGAAAQSASTGNITCVVDGAHRRRALNIVHRTLLEKPRSLALAVVGVGNVGRALLRQILERRASFLELDIDIKVVALADRKRFLVKREGIDLRRWREELDASAGEMTPASLARAIARLDLAHAALIDCTASSSIAEAYPAFIEANLDIVTPNKRGSTQPWPRHLALNAQLVRHRRSLLCETTVGAGLPVLATLQSLIASGDAIEKVEGIFSGTLGYLFNTFEGGVPFSTLVRDAHAMGYTEPDPREDLNGEDVARKLLILARHIGLKMELEDVDIERLVPPHLSADAFSPQFFTDYAAYDADILHRVRCARSRGAVVRYVGTLEAGRAHAELTEVPHDHPFATTTGTDNIVAFTTSRYSRSPLVLRGPGAGADLTAAGILSDVLKLVRIAR